ncbi:dimethylargininase [Glaciihabitans sp. UYNi722]|uniref:dimethylargininase n=1 Tax=Glaciihabitans sp. UYNi722 TaxID=3156344 RepID=UPI003399ECA2
MTVIARPVPFLRRLAAALITALAVAASVQAVTVLLFYVGAGADITTFTQLSDFFLASSLIAFFALAVFALVGIYRYWYTRLIGGLVAALIAAVLGTLLNVLTSGSTVPADLATQLFGTLVGPNLLFVVLVTVGTLTIGERVWRAIVGSTTDESRVAIVRAPAENLAEGEVTHIQRTPLDTELANTQWDNYVATIANAGWDIVEVPVAHGHADSVFVEDAVVLFGDLAVIASPGAESRRGETAEAEKTVRSLGLTIARIEQPGTLDGGDVLKVGKTVYVGRGGRTNAEGIRQLRSIVAPFGYTVVAVPVTKALHLKSAVTALPDGTVIGYEALVDTTSIFDRYLAVPEATGVAVVVLASDTVLMASSAPQSAALIADLGYRVLTVDISEFEKLEGCVTCLSVRLR